MVEGLTRFRVGISLEFLKGALFVKRAFLFLASKVGDFLGGNNLSVAERGG
jgi:hypothetical protein